MIQRELRWQRRLILALAVSGTAISANAQLTKADSASEVAFSNSRVHDFRSAINGQPYRLFVVLPANYEAHKQSSYPVLYVLDGGIALGPAASVYKGANRSNDSLIIVGVGFSDGQGLKYRGIDYALPLTSTPDTALQHAAQAGRCCQAAKTADVFRREIIPLIDRTYRTTDDRGIFGHSWSAIFAAYVLVTSPDLFERYAITSPSPWGDNFTLFDAEVTFAKNNRSLKKRVFISVGADENVFNRYSAARFASTLRARGYEGLDLTSMNIPDAYHTSMQEYVPALRALYPPKQFVEFDTSSVLTDARADAERFLNAYARRDFNALRTTLHEGPGFQAAVAGKMVSGAPDYVSAVRALPLREFAGFHLDTLHGSWDRLSNGADATRRAVFIASYSLRRSARDSVVRRTLYLELTPESESWRVAYVLHSWPDTLPRTTLVMVESDGSPVLDAEVSAEWDAGSFASARTNSKGIAALPFDWRFDWLRTGHVVVRAKGYRPTFLPPPTRDSVIAHLKRMPVR